MKKITLMALACAMFMAPAVANAQEVTYVEDPAQGYTFNRFQDNWFIQAMGGAGIMMSKYDRGVDFADRIGWKGNLVVGKWFSPVWGARVMGEFNQMKGATVYGMAIRTDMDNKLNNKLGRDAHFQYFNNIGAAGDLMMNLTNLIAGYRPGRFYNASVYVGAGIHWAFYNTQANGKGDWKYGGDKDGKNAHARNLCLRAGLLNSFAITKNFNILLDLRFEEMQEHVDGLGNRTWVEYPSALLGIGYNFNKTDWTAPVVPVCPTYKYTDAEGDALVARLSQADRKIAELEEQLKHCGKPGPQPGPRPAPAGDAPLATVYFPINVSKIVGVQNDVVDAVANVMLQENNNYQLTGWADNYTGNNEINTRLRKDRVATVKNALVKKGVADSRLNTQIDDRNRPDADFGPKSAPLSRAVTIVRNK